MMETKPGGLPRLVQNNQYLSVSEAAKVLGVSERSIYGYIRSGKLPGERIGQTIVVRRDALESCSRRAVGRPRTRTLIWRTPVRANLQYMLTLNVRLYPNQERRFKEKVDEIRMKQKHLLPGTVARYIVQQTSEPQAIQIVLSWRQQMLPSEQERQAVLTALRADFLGILDWDHASSAEGFVLLNT